MHLNQNHYRLMSIVKGGATIYNYTDAVLLREIQKYNRNLLEIVEGESGSILREDMNNLSEPTPYFSASLTKCGIQFLHAYIK